jgi:hypothetical protein
MQLKPLVQGNLSRLCGLYSLINSIRLAAYPKVFRKNELQDLYSEVIWDLSRRRQLKRVLGVGMTEELWLSVGAALIHHVNDTHGTALKLTPVINGAAKHDRERALRAIRRTIARGTPVLASLGGALNHYSAFCGYTPSRLMVFDSSGLRWVEAKQVGLGERSRRRHWISHHGTVAITDDW